MRTANVVPVTVRREYPAHILQGNAGGSQGRFDRRLRRGRHTSVDQSWLGRIDVINVDDATRLAERTRNWHDTRLCRHGRYVNVPAMVSIAPRACTWYIRHVDMFRRLSPRDADGLTHAMNMRHFAAGQLIVGPDTQPELVCLTRTGTVRLFRRATSGRQTTIERLASGHLFGVTAFLPSDAGGLLAEAETEVDLCVVDGRHFLDVVSRWPEAVLELAARLGVRVREADELVGNMTATGARARLAAALHRLARDASETQPGGGLRLRAVPRHSDLANDIGATRETVTRMLARLEQDGYIRRYGRQIVLPDPDRLADDFDLSS